MEKGEAAAPRGIQRAVGKLRGSMKAVRRSATKRRKTKTNGKRKPKFGTPAFRKLHAKKRRKR